MISFMSHLERSVKQGPAQGSRHLCTNQIAFFQSYSFSRKQQVINSVILLLLIPQGKCQQTVNTHVLRPWQASRRLRCPCLLRTALIPEFGRSERRAASRSSCPQRPLVAYHIATVFIHHLNTKSLQSKCFSPLLLGLCSSLINALCCLLCTRHIFFFPHPWTN